MKIAIQSVLIKLQRKDGLSPCADSRWLVLACALTFWQHRTLLGKEPGVTMAVALMALKTLELRARRDAFVVFFLGFFLVLTHFL